MSSRVKQYSKEYRAAADEKRGLLFTLSIDRKYTVKNNEGGYFDVQGVVVKPADIAVLTFAQKIVGYHANPVKAAEELLVELKAIAVAQE